VCYASAVPALLSQYFPLLSSDSFFQAVGGAGTVTTQPLPFLPLQL
jgi:hypothetical protein